jgi:hypothetical protein
MTEIIRANFEVGKNDKISGVMDCKTSSKKFSCWSSERFSIDNHSNIYGKTDKNQYISLLNCLGDESTYQSNNQSSYSCEVYSHTMIMGNEKIVPESDKFTSISLTVGNPLKLFMRLKSFGYVNVPDPKLIDVLNEQKYTPRFDTEKRTIIAYFNGDFDIFEQDTKLGKIKAHNIIHHGSLGSVTGVTIENKIMVTIDFHNGVSLDEAFKRANLVTLFFRFIGGQGLYFKDISLRKIEHEHNEFTVYHDSCNWGKEEDEEDDFYTRPLINVTNHSFLEILKNWFDKDDRESVRYSFYNTYFREIYSPDRLITAANMFDIFPIADNDKKKIIHPDADLLIKNLKNHLKTEFSDFDEIRNSLLQSIGSITRKSLKERVLDRIEIIRPHLIGHVVCVEDIKFIIGIAIKSRNYHVHGTKYKKLTPEKLFEFQSLFIDTFEYIYAISELIECGWQGSETPLSWSNHRIKGYERQIGSEVRNLKKVFDV